MSNFMLRTLSLVALAFTMTCSTLTSTLSADENVYQSTLKSTAWITTSNATGTGVVVDRDERLVITNYHVIQGNEKVTVFFPTERAGRTVAEKSFYRQNKKLGIPALVVASDKQRDMAILKLDRIPDGIEAIVIGKPCSPGQSIHSLGNPGASGALWNYSCGKVRQNYYMETRYEFGKTQMQMLETTALINEGDSGGPIVNDQGELVGISQGYARKHRGYSYGVDISEVTWYLKQYSKSSTMKVATDSSDSNLPKVNSDLDTNTPAGETKSVSAKPGSFKDLPVFASNDK